MPLAALFLACASPRVGAGHDSRTQLLAAACERAGMVVDRLVLDEGDSPASHRRLTEALYRRAWDVVVLDGPDAFVDGRVGRLPPGALKVAFRMYGPGDGSGEDVAVTPSPAETYEDRRPDRLVVGGRAYLFVRPRLFEARGVERDGVLVTMGGADPGDATTLACEALEPLAYEHRVTVVVGRLNPRYEELHRRFGGAFRVLRQVEADFDALLSSAAVAVINGGLTRYECVAAATPFVAVSLDERQAAFTDAVVSAGFGRHAGLLASASPRTILAMVRELLEQPGDRSEMAERARGLVSPDAPGAFALALAGWRARLVSGEGRP